MNLTDKQRMQFRRMNYAFWEYQPLDGGTDRNAEVLQPPEPDQLADYVWTISPTKVNEAAGDRQPGRCLYPGGHGELPGSHHRRHQLPVHLPDGQTDPDPHPDREHVRVSPG